MIDTSSLSGRPAWLEQETLFEKSVKVGVFAVILFVIIYPFFSVVATSLASDQDVIKNGGLVIWPEHLARVDPRRDLHQQGRVRDGRARRENCRRAIGRQA